MSQRRRWIKRVLWIAVCAGIGFVGYQAYQRTQGDNLWQRAQTAVSLNRSAEAKVLLLNVVKQQPDHGEANLALAQLSLAAAGKNAKYAEQPAALKYLAVAGRMRPKDLDLQKQLLGAYLDAGRPKDAHDVARRVVTLDPNDPDALTAFSLHAVRAYREADEELSRMLTSSQARGHRALAIRAKLDMATKNQPHFQQLLTEGAAKALAATADELATLPEREYEAMVALLISGVSDAPDAATAEHRADQAMQVWETLAQAQPSRTARPRYLREAAEAATQLALVTAKKLPRPVQQAQPAQAAAAGPAAAPPVDAEAVDASPSDEAVAEAPVPPPTLAARAETLRQAAIEAGQANAFVYHHAALAALQRNDVPRAVELAKSGIAVADNSDEKLPLQRFAGLVLVAIRSPEAQPMIDSLLAEAEPKSIGWGHLLSGMIDLQTQQLNSALDHYLEARRRLGYVIEVRTGLIDVYLGLKRWNEALPELTGLAADKPAPANDADAYVLTMAAALDRYIELGQLRAYWGLQAWDKALAMINTMADRQPNADSFKALLQSALYSAARQPEAALAISHAARQANPQDFVLLLNEVRLLLQAKRWDEAEKLAEDADQSQEATPRCLALAQLFESAGRSALGRRWAERSLASATDEKSQFLAHASLANAAMVRWKKTKDRPAALEAREHYTAMLEIQPRNLVAGNNLAWLLAVDFDEPQEAVRIVEQCRGDVAADKLPLSFVDTLAVVYRQAGRPAQAIEVLRSALSRAPQRSELHYQLGLALLADGRPAAGRGELKTALTLGLQGDEAVQARQALQTLPGE